MQIEGSGKLAFLTVYMLRLRGLFLSLATLKFKFLLAMISLAAHELQCIANRVAVNKWFHGPSSKTSESSMLSPSLKKLLQTCSNMLEDLWKQLQNLHVFVLIHTLNKPTFSCTFWSSKVLVHVLAPQTFSFMCWHIQHSCSPIGPTNILLYV